MDFLQHINELNDFVTITRNFLSQIDLMDINDKRGIFDALITARNNLDSGIIRYLDNANTLFLQGTAESCRTAYIMMESFKLPEADSLRDDIIRIFLRDSYQVKEDLIISDANYYHRQCDSSAHPDYNTHQKILGRYTYVKNRCLQEVDRLSMRTHPQILAQWANARGTNN